MNASQQVEILKELHALSVAGQFFTSEGVSGRSSLSYSSRERFSQEWHHLMTQRPFAAAHSSELPAPGDFKTLTILGTPTLIVRGDDGEPRAFRNACRHRGMRLVDGESGCAKRFTCPYHAWTYDQTGAFVSGPHFGEGFPGLETADLSLHSLSCEERWGFVWVNLNPEERGEPLGSLTPLADDLEWLAPESLCVVADTHLDIAANWKLLVEGGLEAYHFKIAHRATIGPYFAENLSSYSVWGENIRSVLPRKTLAALDSYAPEQWLLREHANIIYTLMPTCQLLVQQDHIVWINATPLAANRTQLRLATLASPADRTADHWAKNHRITLDTLGEDFAIAEAIQASIEGGLNQTLHFGRYESALDRFNSLVEAALPES